MRMLLPTLVFVGSLSGCVETSRYYLPTDPGLAREQAASCTRITHGYASLRLAERSAVRLTMAPVGDGVQLALQTKLVPGQRLRLASSTVVLEELGSGSARYVFELGSWTSVVHGPGGVVIFRDAPDSNGWILGKDPRDHERAAQSYAFNLFTASASVVAPRAEQYRLVLPAMEVDGAQIAARTVDVRLRQHTGLSACVQ